MVFRTLLGLIVSFFVAQSLWANSPSEISINPNHPQQYTVIRGDTLWEISGKFLNHPTQWPELWSWNPQIKNPNLIYPGDTLYFSIVNGQPRLSFSPNPDSYEAPLRSDNCVINEEDIHNGHTSFAMAPNNSKLKPCIRETNIADAIRLIPAESINKFLSYPEVVGANDLQMSPYVVGFAGERAMGSTGDKVYIRSILDSQNFAFTLYRSGQTYKNPDTGEILGYEAIPIAEATLKQTGDPATLVVDKAYREILKGDRLMQKAERQFTLNYFPRPPEESIKGSIIGVLDGVTQIGRYNVVAIDKGTRDGLQIGHELDIYKRGRIARDTYSPIGNDTVKLPDELAGKLMVFRPYERVSYALVMNTNQAVQVLDRVETP